MQAPLLPIRVHLLGGFRIEVGGRPLTEGAWSRRKGRQLFKCLVGRRTRRLTRDEAFDLFWPDSPPESASTNLRSSVHAIRQAFRSAGYARSDQVVRLDRDGVTLDPNLEWCIDAEVLERLASDAAAAADPQPLLEQVCALYAGDYLPDDTDAEWAAERRLTLRRIWRDAAYQLARLKAQRGEPEVAVRELQRVLSVDPCDERAAQALIELLTRLGRRAEALRTYHDLERTLRDELDVPPSERTRATHVLAATVDTYALEHSLGSFRCAYPFPQPVQLLGRQSELDRLRRVLGRVHTAGQVVLVSAPAGTGKSALLGRLVREAQQQGMVCLAGGSYDNRSVVPLAAFQEALGDYLVTSSFAEETVGPESPGSQLASAVRELRGQFGLGAPPAAEVASDRTRLFGSVLTFLRGVAERRPVLLCLEDLHSADAATMHLTYFLARQTRRVPVMLVASFRSEQVRTGEPLAQLVTALARERLAEQICLEPLERAEADRLTSLLLGKTATEATASLLFAATEGNPLFLEQLAPAVRKEHGLPEARDVQQSVSAGGWKVPPVVGEVIGQRLASLSSRARNTLEASAVLGATFDHDMLLALVEPPSEAVLLEDLDEAIRAKVLRETTTGYAFSHALLREGVYWSLSGPRRMLLHARVGSLLENRAGRRANRYAAELAHHFALAGRGSSVGRKALEYSMEAGREAARLCSYQEALEHFSRASQLSGRDDLDIDLGTRLDALEGRGNAERELARWTACVKTFREVLALSRQPVQRARAYCAIAYALHHTERAAEGLAEVEAGLMEIAIAPDSASSAATRLRLQLEKALHLFLEGRFEAQLKLGRQMLESATRWDEPRALISAHNAIGIAQMGRGQVDEALRHFELAGSTAEALQDKVQLAISLDNRGLQNYRAGRFAVAEAHLGQALNLYREMAASQLGPSATSRAVNTLQALGRVHLAQGDVAKAWAFAERASELAQEVEDRWAAECHHLMASIHALRADWAVARTHFEQSLTIRERVGHRSGAVESHVGLGLVRQRLGDWHGARDHYVAAADAAAEMDPCPHRLAAVRQLARAELHTGNHAVAAELLGEAAQMGEQMPRSIEYGPTLLAVAECEAHVGASGTALEVAERALAAGGTAEFALEAHLFLAALLQDLAQPGRARVHNCDALALAKQLGSSYWLKRAGEALAAPGAPVL